jgi:hypothetical protein
VNRRRHLVSPIALLVAALLLLAQGVLAPAAVFAAGPLLPGNLPMCHTAGANDPAPASPAPHHHDPFCCVLCHHAGADILAPPAPQPALKLPTLIAIVAAPPPPRAPPASVLFPATYPTGPPHLA